MPELPEVAALVEFLDERTRGLVVRSVSLGQIAALKTYAPPLDALAGGAVVGARRHGKWLDVVVGPGATDAVASATGAAAGAGAGASPDDAPLHLVFHLSRGGWLRWHDVAPTAPVRPRAGGGGPHRPTLALRVVLDDGSGFDLTEAGTRKRLAVHVVHDAAEVPQIASLGIDPLSKAFTAERLTELLAARNQQIKGLLRDQGTIAGIGNAYSDEILHAARTSPFRLTKTYASVPDDVAALHRSIVDVLADAVAAASGKPAAELKDAKRRGMRVHGRTGEPCPGWDGTPCGDVVHEVSFADSSLQYCPTCQTGGQVLADRRMSRLLR